MGFSCALLQIIMCIYISHGWFFSRPPAIIFVNSRKGSLLLAEAINKVTIFLFRSNVNYPFIMY